MFCVFFTCKNTNTYGWNGLIIQTENIMSFLCGKSHLQCSSENKILLLIMRCWASWAITLYDWLCAMNMRNVNKPNCFSAQAWEALLKGIVLTYLSLSLSLSHTWPHNPAGALTDSFQNNPWEARSCSEQQQVCFWTKKRRQMDRQTDENGWTNYPNWPCLTSVIHSHCKYHWHTGV